MPSALPSRSNGYLFALDHNMDPTTLNSFAGDAHNWLTALEAGRGSYLDTIAQLQSEALDAIQVGIAPQVQTVRDELTALEAAIALAEDQLLAIQQGGVSAENVGETATRVFVTPAQRDEIGMLRTDVDAKASEQATSNALASMSAAIAASQARALWLAATL